MKRHTRRYQIEIENHSVGVNAENKSDAIDRAITKIYGSNCFWFPDSGIPGYGQVFEALRPTKNNSNPGNSSVTYRRQLSVKTVGKPSRNFLKQLAEDRAEYEKTCALIQAENDRKHDAYISGRTGGPKPDDEFYMDDYRDGVRDRDYEKSEKQAEIDREERESAEKWTAYVEGAHTEAIAENQKHEKLHLSILDEIDRLKQIPVDAPISDVRLATIIRNTIAPSTHIQGSMPLGEWKSRMVNGEYPEIVLEWLDSSAIYNKLKNIIGGVE